MPPAHRSSPVTIFSCVYLYDGFIPVYARTYTRSCLSASVRTRTHTSFMHTTYIDIYIYAYIPVYIYIRWVLCAPGVGGSKDKAEESMHVLLRILSRSLRVHTQVHLYVHAYLLSLYMYAVATLCPQEVFAFLRHRNMRALQHLPAFASGCVRVRTRNWCVLLCAHLSLSLPLSLSTCEYIPALTYTRTHIRTSKVAYKHAGTDVYIASTAPSAPGASTRGFQHTGTAHASGFHRRVAACIACYCEPARVLAEPRTTI